MLLGPNFGSIRCRPNSSICRPLYPLLILVRYLRGKLAKPLFIYFSELALEEHYWNHVENFPMHFGGLKVEAIDELINVFSHGRAGEYRVQFGCSAPPASSVQRAECDAGRSRAADT